LPALLTEITLKDVEVMAAVTNEVEKPVKAKLAASYFTAKELVVRST
jgi:hypothetical protein